jgi:uncharacterized protein YbjT (DUF2867 family)
MPDDRAPGSGAPGTQHVLIFGATGMVGQGVLRECLRAPDVARVVTVGRAATGQSHPKLREVVAGDLSDLSAHEPALAGFGACFFCLGVSALGMSEAAYARVTHDLTLAVARTLARLNPAMTFVYVSGAGTDSTERGRVMWARVKGRTENALLALPFGAAYMFRPGVIQPLHGIRSKTRAYRIGYALLAPVMPLLRRVAPNVITTTEQVGRAMLAVVRQGYPKAILEQADINAL